MTSVSQLNPPDIGGGSVDNDSPHTLARIPLRWMIGECFKTATGIMFHSDRLRQELGLEPARLFPVVMERPKSLSVRDGAGRVMKIRKMPKAGKEVGGGGSTEALLEHSADPYHHNGGDGTIDHDHEKTEEEEELHDALSPIYDQLSLAPRWWALEVLPMMHKYQKVPVSNLFVTRYVPNVLFRPSR